MLKLFYLTTVFATLLVFSFSLSAQDYDELNNQAYKERDNKNYNKAIELATQSIVKQVNARAYIIRASSRYYLNDYEAAIDDYTSALTYYSNYYSNDKEKAGIYYWRGVARNLVSKYNDAISDFGSALYYNYEEPGYVYWYRGNCYYSQADYKQSEDDYIKAIDRTSDSKDLSTLYKYRADCKAEQGDYTTACSLYTRAISYNSDNSRAYWQRGYYEDIEGKDQEALTDYSKAAFIILTDADGSNDKDLVSLYRNQALIYKRFSQYDSALVAINKSLLIDPNSTKIYKTRAEIYRDMKKYDKAKDDYRNAISLESDKINIGSLYFDRSWMEMQNQDFKSTLEDLNKSIEYNPQDAMSYWHRSIIYGYKKNFPAAIKDCSYAMTLYKNDSSSTRSLYNFRASLKQNAGDYSGAIQDYQSSIKLYPNDYNTYYELGRLFKTKIKNNDLADANLSKAAMMAQQNEDTSTYCYITVIKGDKEEAIKKMMEMLEVSKTSKYNHSWALHNMACIYALAGNTSKAVECQDKSLAEGFDSYNHLLFDRDLESIMNLSQWKTILVKYKVPQPKW